MSFYTIDNLQAQWEGVHWNLLHHTALAEAITAYQTLPDTRVRVLGGILDGLYEIDLVQCQPLHIGDGHGEDVLVCDYLKLPRWNRDPEVLSTVDTLHRELGITKMLSEGRILDIPQSESRDHCFMNKHLSPVRDGSLKSAIIETRVDELGWLDQWTFQHLFGSDSPNHNLPYVKLYRTRCIGPDEIVRQVDMSPVDFDRLLARTKEFLHEQSARREREKRTGKRPVFSPER